ncbi:MAG: hypothetical protein ABFD82_14570 [Syntrophaceae bacterium]
MKKINVFVVGAAFIIGFWLLGAIPQAMAETINIKFFSHVTKMESVTIPNVDGHAVRFVMSEGVTVLDTGEMAWLKSVAFSDLTKGSGSIELYTTHTFPDGSSMTTHTKGTVKATTAGVVTAQKWAGDIIHGTGRFQGIKGTITTSSKRLPPEKGELAGKTIGEGTLDYTPPSK